MGAGDEIPKMIDFLAARARLRPDAAPINPETAVPNGPPPISQDPWFEMLGAIEKPGGPEDLYIWVERNGKRVRLDGPFKTRLDAQRQLKLMEQSGARGMNLSIAGMNPQE